MFILYTNNKKQEFQYYRNTVVVEYMQYHTFHYNTEPDKPKLIF